MAVRKPNIVHTRPINGRWYLYRYEKDATGKWRQRAIKGEAFDKEMDASLRAAELTVEYSKGKVPLIQDVLLQEVADKWLKIALSRAAAESTKRRYKIHVKQLIDSFGDTPVQKITKELIETFLAEYASTRAPRTVNKTLNKLQAILSAAVDWGYIEASSAGKVAPYKARKARIKAFRPQEVGKIIAAADPIDRVILLLTYDTGMRINEVLPLRKDQIDLEECAVLLEEHESDLKTDAAIRIIPITPEMRDILADYLDGFSFNQATPPDCDNITDPRKVEVLAALNKYGAIKKALEETGVAKSVLWYWRKKDQSFVYAINYAIREARLKRLTCSPYLFPSETGQPISYSNFRKKVWLPLLERLGVDITKKEERFGPHSFRHSFVSEMIQAGEDILTIAKLVGHKDPTTTTREYGHMFVGAQEAAIRRKSERFGNLYAKTMQNNESDDSDKPMSSLVKP
ncbi:MAG: site-specific integrase [Actinobacteria bacterium]|nr:site-specific integrase [Actinomycetota bacterium]